jgi:hypothetical protein
MNAKVSQTSIMMDNDLDDVIGLLNEASETPKHYVPNAPKGG